MHLAAMQLLRKRNCFPLTYRGRRWRILRRLGPHFYSIFFHLSALRSVWFAFSKEVGPEMNSSQPRKASTRAEPLVKLMPKLHALPKELRPQSVRDESSFIYMSACPRLQGGCVVQICHTIWVNCNRPLGTPSPLFSRDYFCWFEEDCSRAMGQDTTHRFR